MWILYLAEVSHEISSIFSEEKKWKNIQDCRLLQVVISYGISK